jgi:hypothetical protein
MYWEKLNRTPGNSFCNSTVSWSVSLSLARLIHRRISDVMSGREEVRELAGILLA